METDNMKDRRNPPDSPPRGSSALDGVRIVDLSRVLSGPYATQLLADHGADVIKVEPPGGDETRGWGPPFAADTSAYFQGLNRNKRGISLDLAQPPGRQQLLRLLEDADVLVENFKSGTMERWGLGYDTLSARFPRLVHCRVSGFGADGPMGGLPGYDAAIQAVSGIMSVNGERDGDPTRVGIPIVDIVTGLNAALGVLLALQERQRSGRGQFVDMALFDCALSILHPHSANFFASGNIPQRTGNAHPNITPYDVFPTRTTPVFLAVGNDRQFKKLCEAIHLPTLADDPRYATNEQRNQHRQSLRATLIEALASHDGQELAHTLIQSGVPISSVLDVSESLAHPHALHREMVIREGSYQGIASPIKLSRTPARFRNPPPSFAQHQQEFDFGPEPA